MVAMKYQLLDVIVKLLPRTASEDETFKDNRETTLPAVVRFLAFQFTNNHKDGLDTALASESEPKSELNYFQKIIINKNYLYTLCINSIGVIIPKEYSCFLIEFHDRCLLSWDDGSLFFWAIQLGNESLLALLISEIRIWKEIPQRKIRYLSLFYAAGQGHETLIQLLLASISQSEDATDGILSQRMMLWIAAILGHNKVVQVLLDHGCRDLFKSKAGGQALWLALGTYEPSMQKAFALLQAGAPLSRDFLYGIFERLASNSSPGYSAGMIRFFTEMIPSSSLPVSPPSGKRRRANVILETRSAFALWIDSDFATVEIPGRLPGKNAIWFDKIAISSAAVNLQFSIAYPTTPGFGLTFSLYQHVDHSGVLRQDRAGLLA